MIVNNDPNYEEKRALQERLARSEDYRKEEMLSELRKESLSVICLAVMYAKAFEQYGIDITKAWETAEQQMAILQRTYNDGYHKGLFKGIGQGKQIAQEEANKELGLGQEEFVNGPTITKDVLKSEKGK